MTLPTEKETAGRALLTASSAVAGAVLLLLLAEWLVMTFLL